MNWAAVPYDPANFTGNLGMGWNVLAADQVNFRYKLEDTTMSVQLNIHSTQIPAGPLSAALLIEIPEGRRVAYATQYNACQIRVNGAYEAGLLIANFSIQKLVVMRMDLSDWLAGLTSVFGQIQFEVEGRRLR